MAPGPPTEDYPEHQHATMAEAERQRREYANSQSKLLNLPAELRNKIHYFVLADEIIDISDLAKFKFCTTSKSSIVYDTPDYSDPTTDNQRFPPGMLQTCRQLRNEAWKIYYSTNTFVIRPEPGNMYRHPKLAVDWLAMQPPGACALIETIMTISYMYCRIVEGCTLKVLINLKTRDVKRLRCPQDKECCDKEARAASRAKEARSLVEETRKAQEGLGWEDIIYLASCFNGHRIPFWGL